MNDTPETGAPSQTRSAVKGAAKADEAPTASTTPSAASERTSVLDWLSTLFRQRNGSSLREDLTDALAEVGAPDKDAFSPAERAMLNNILRLREVRVEDVMVPRADIQAVEINTSLGDLLTVFEESGHSRMPVYAETLDDPRGMVHIRDVLAHITRTARVKKGRTRKAGAYAGPLDLSNVDLTRTIGELSLMRTVLFVPPSMLASDLMGRMQASRTQMALVIDEYGGTDGLASLEDIVEMVVGDIEDEHDEDLPLITKAGEGVYIVDGKAEIDDVAQVIGSGFAPGEHAEDVDTIGGMIFNALGRVPTRGEVIQAIPGFEFNVLDADPRRVKRVRIVETRLRRRPAKPEQTEPAERAQPAEASADRPEPPAQAG
jgi:CBS domain containing-hemolysin-like protein